MTALPREFELLAACCRWPRNDAADEEVRRLAAQVNWESFVALAERHRVEGLAHHALRGAGAEAPGRLGAAAAEIARENLGFAAEALRLHSDFDDARIPHLFVKGLTLAAIAYGTIALKRSCDIDLLVGPARYREGCALLERAGYACVHPGPLPVADIERHAALEKDSVWRHAGTRITVELHQRLTANPIMLPSIAVDSPRQDVAIAPGAVLPTLADEELFAYLSVHGALSGWSRLKWAADLAALLAPLAPAEIERRYRRAMDLAPGRSAAMALLLCAELLGTRLTDALAAELSADPANARLVRAAVRTLLRNGASKQRFGTAGIHFATLFLRPGWRYKASEVRRQLRRIRAR